MTAEANIKKFGGIMSYMTGKGQVWCAHCANWADAGTCAIVDNFIKCEECIKKENTSNNHS